jgi:hypothetical protein
MPVGGPGPEQLAALSARLREMGKDGGGLRRELYKAIDEAAQPLTRKIGTADHLEPYMPNRYAGVLAGDLAVTAVKRGGQRASVSIRAKGRAHKRKVQHLNAGILSHPVYGDRKKWVTQRAGMRSGFFSDAVREQAPDIRERVQQAVHDVAAKITS